MRSLLNQLSLKSYPPWLILKQPQGNDQKASLSMTALVSPHPPAPGPSETGGTSFPRLCGLLRENENLLRSFVPVHFLAPSGAGVQQQPQPSFPRWLSRSCPSAVRSISTSCHRK